jgi:hypothetical protein
MRGALGIALAGKSRVRGIGAALIKAGESDFGYVVSISAAESDPGLFAGRGSAESWTPPPHPARRAAANAAQSPRETVNCKEKTLSVNRAAG